MISPICNVIQEGDTALITACHMEYEEVVQLLVEAERHFNPQNEEVYTSRRNINYVKISKYNYVLQ